MTVMWIIFGLIIIAGFIFAVIKLNAYSEMAYGYTPVNMGNIFLGFIPWIIILGGMYGESHGEVDSLVLGIFFATIAAVIIFRSVAKKTSVGVAIATVLIIMTINVVIVLFAMGREASRNNDYYYYDD